MSKLDELMEGLKAFYGHRGRPGKRGGSMPKGGGESSPIPPKKIRTHIGYAGDVARMSPDQLQKVNARISLPGKTTPYKINKIENVGENFLRLHLEGREPYVSKRNERVSYDEEIFE